MIGGVRRLSDDVLVRAKFREVSDPQTERIIDELVFEIEYLRAKVKHLRDAYRGIQIGLVVFMVGASLTIAAQLLGYVLK